MTQIRKTVNRKTRAARGNFDDEISIKEAAALRGVTTGRISQLITDGRLRSKHDPIFGRRVVSRSDVIDFRPQKRGRPRAARCARGHPFTAANVYATKDGQHRECRACKSARARQYHLDRK